LRFAVRRPGIPEASPRSHGVPRRDVPCRIHISIAGETAGSAHEARLALARLRVHVPARRATLARVMRLDLLYPAGCLLSQSADKEAPARPQDLPVETRLGADVPAWIPCGSLSRARHIRDLEILDPDHVKPLSDVRAGLLSPVFPPVCLAGLQPCDGQLDPRAAVRPAPGPGELALQAPHALAQSRGQAGSVQQFPSRQRGGDGHTSVNSCGLPVARRRDRMGNSREGDMPAPGPVHRHPVRLHARWHDAGPAEAYPPGLRHPDVAHLTGKAAHMPGLNGDDSESLIPADLAPRRPPGRILWVEERDHRLGEVSQCLLLHLGAGSQPRVIRPCLGELSALLQVARSTLPAQAPMGMLLHGQIPHISSVGAVIPQHGLLGGHGVQPIPRHGNTVANSTDISGEVKRRPVFSSKAGVFTPRFT
jgi:hypothetical protein